MAASLPDLETRWDTGRIVFGSSYRTVRGRAKHLISRSILTLTIFIDDRLWYLPFHFLDLSQRRCYSWFLISVVYSFIYPQT